MAKRKTNNDNKTLQQKIQKCNDAEGTIFEKFMNICDDVNRQLSKIHFDPVVQYIYNPTEYASKSLRKYVEIYCNDKKKVLFLGINPGPWGMSQTGVPFGDVDTVKKWLLIEEEVLKPQTEHPQRPVQGFNCTRVEVSGKRFWGLMKEISKEPGVFFRDCFVYNYFPLQLMNKCGKNLPPSALKPKVQQEIFDVCDEALKKVVLLYEVTTIVAVGKYAETRAKAALSDLNVKVKCILHPSPQSKAANNWHVDARKQLEELRILEHLTAKI